MKKTNTREEIREIVEALLDADVGTLEFKRISIGVTDQILALIEKEKKEERERIRRKINNNLIIEAEDEFRFEIKYMRTENWDKLWEELEKEE